MQSKKFELTFAKIYPDFTKKLIQSTSNLTPQEVRVCMCMRMSFSNVQIREHLNISVNTLANTRSSIRNKFGLKRSESLTKAIICV